jgi:hypothetical protein
MPLSVDCDFFIDIFLCPLNVFCLLFSIIGKLRLAVMDFGVALGKHVDISSCGTEAFAKVSNEMLFQFFFALSTNSSGR